MYASNAGYKHCNYEKITINAPPLPSPITCTKDNNKCNLSWIVYDISFRNAVKNVCIFINKQQ